MQVAEDDVRTALNCETLRKKRDDVVSTVILRESVGPTTVMAEPLESDPPTGSIIV